MEKNPPQNNYFNKNERQYGQADIQTQRKVANQYGSKVLRQDSAAESYDHEYEDHQKKPLQQSRSGGGYYHSLNR